MIAAITSSVSVLTKTWVTLPLAVLAVFEFITAMYIFGGKGPKPHMKTVLTVHRVGGYIFGVCWLWPIIVGLDLLGRLSRYSEGWTFDGNRFFHAGLGVTVFVLLVLKIAFVRFYPNYRPSARLLGLIITAGAVITWIIAGGFWLAMMGGRSLH